MPKRSTIAAVAVEKAYGIFAAIAFTVVTVPTIALMLVIPGESRRRRLARRAAALVLKVWGTGPGVVGLANLPVEPCVVVANHASYLDGIILTAVLPPRFTFVIKREMTQVPLAHFLLRRLGSEFVERTDRNRGAVDARRIMQKAQEKRSLAFFPEGTFLPEPGLRRFHYGAFAAAKRGELPVVPVTIRGSRRMLPADRLLPVRSRIEVIIKPRIDLPTESSLDDLLDACRRRILEDLGEPDAAESSAYRTSAAEMM